MANLQRDMVQLMDFVQVSAAEPVKGRRRTEALARMKKALDALDVKPDKGRRKDLRRIERAISSMMKCISTS
ncbi:MAG TPA: hypothetical protein VFY29_16805 [Terriglobia bacterium]|nr:hypothetical protein [Terriglobia bacterium]